MIAWGKGIPRELHLLFFGYLCCTSIRTILTPLKPLLTLTNASAPTTTSTFRRLYAYSCAIAVSISPTDQSCTTYDPQRRAHGMLSDRSGLSFAARPWRRAMDSPLVEQR